MSGTKRLQRPRLPEDFLGEMKQLEASYLKTDDPLRQSGYGGGYERWCRERGVILDPIKTDGTFLDIGCANGYLLECLIQWAQDKGIRLIPFGADIGPQLVELAKARLPVYKSNFWVADAWEWTPPFKFHYVYTLCDCVPPSFFKGYVSHLLSHYVETNGILIIGAYGSTSKNQPAQEVEKELQAFGFSVAGAVTLGTLPVTKIAWMAAE